MNRLLAGVALCAALIAPAAQAETRVLDGTVTYREKMLLPPGARVQVQLADVSLADAPAKVLGETTFTPKTPVPLRFRIKYDDRNVTPNHSYALQARITLGDELLFTNTSRHAVFGDQPDATEILVERVGPGQVDPLPLPAYPTGEWLAEDIGGKGVLDRAQSTLVLGKDGAVTGSGGCNRLMAKVRFERSGIAISDLAATRRLCEEPLNKQEMRFFKALTAARQWQLDDATGKLTLLDNDDRVLVVLSRK